MAMSASVFTGCFSAGVVAVVFFLSGLWVYGGCRCFCFPLAVAGV